MFSLLAMAWLCIMANSSAELMTASESISLGIAARPEELALPKVAVLFDDMTATESFGNVQVVLFLESSTNKETSRKYG